MTNVTADLVNLFAESDALRLAELVREKEVTPAELTETAIHLIENSGPEAERGRHPGFRTREGARGGGSPEGPFGGVPYLLKNIGSGCEGLPLTNSLPFRKDYVSPSDSEMVRRIKASGLNILGRTNVPEQGWCIATEPRMYGPTLNPWNTAVTAGGSSGGAVSAVASRMIPMAEASDGGGSIRAPASCCGVVGLKPSRGRITYGPDDVDVWFGSVSTFAVTRSVRDTAALLDATAVVMPGDPYTPPKPAQSWLDCLREPVKPLKIGYALTPPWGAPFAPEVTDAMTQTLSILQDLGHVLEEHAMVTDLEAAWRDYNQMNSVQTVLEFDEHGEASRTSLFRSSELIAFNRAWLARGRGLSGRDYAASVAAVRKANQRVQSELAPFDVFLTPTLTQLPRPVGYWDLNEPDFDKYVATWTDAAFLFPVQSFWPAGDIRAGDLERGRHSGRRAACGTLRR